MSQGKGDEVDPVKSPEPPWTRQQNWSQPSWPPAQSRPPRGVGKLLGLGCCQAWPAVQGPGGPVLGARGSDPQSLSPAPSRKHPAQEGVCGPVRLAKSVPSPSQACGLPQECEMRWPRVTQCPASTRAPPPTHPASPDPGMGVNGCPQCAAHCSGGWGHSGPPESWDDGALGRPYSRSPSWRSCATGSWPKHSSPHIPPSRTQDTPPPLSNHPGCGGPSPGPGGFLSGEPLSPSGVFASERAGFTGNTLRS